MKIALLADIHGNNYALEAVLEKMKGVDEFWFLGDLVGRGPDPVEPLRWLLKNVNQENWIPGNHEAILAKQLRPLALQRVEFKTRLTIDKHREYPEVQEWITNKLLPCFKMNELIKVSSNRIINTTTIISHASWEDPLGINNGSNGYTYAWGKETYKSEFKHLISQKYTNQLVIKCFGHTHVPTLISATRDQDIYEAYFVKPFQTYPLSPDKLWLINPGSVGTPRDLDTRASYAILELGVDEPSVTFHRVRYPLDAVRNALENLEETHNFPSAMYETYFEQAKPDDYTYNHPEWIDHFKKMKLVNEHE